MTAPHPDPRRARLYGIVFESETPAGRAFDLALLVAILASVAVVMADSVQSISARFSGLVFSVKCLFVRRS